MTEQHEAGRALDALVAERVFLTDTTPLEWCAEWRPIPGGGTYHEQCVRCGNARAVYGTGTSRSGPCVIPLPRYSSDIAAAMLVVEKINDLTDMTWNPFAEPGTEWAVRFSRAAYAPTLPLAICRAALAAAGESDE